MALEIHHARTLAAALLHEGLDVDRLNANARAELRKALDLILDLVGSSETKSDDTRIK